jgi:hypothetical protein
MKRTRMISLAVLTALALGAISAAAAQATEGPFYKINGARLAAGSGQAAEAKIKPGSEYVLTAGGVVISCTAQKLQAGSELLGSNTNNSSTSKEVVEFESCKVENNGPNCKLKTTTITTEKVANTLDFANAARTGTILIFFRPVEKTVFAKIVFANDKECTLPSTSVEGTTAAEALSEAGGKVEVGSEPAKAKIGRVNFPATPITKDFVEVGGSLKEVVPSLKAFGKAATLVGTSEISLPAGKEWCIATGAAGSAC